LRNYQCLKISPVHFCHSGALHFLPPFSCRRISTLSSEDFGCLRFYLLKTKLQRSVLFSCFWAQSSLILFCFCVKHDEFSCR
jgi:hypothetical protein